MNPCAAINDLLPFQGSPFGQLGYFSKFDDTALLLWICFRRRERDSNPRPLSESLVFKTSSLNHSDISPVLFSVFPRRALSRRKKYSSTSLPICQPSFSIFLIFFLQGSDTAAKPDIPRPSGFPALTLSARLLIRPAACKSVRHSAIQSQILNCFVSLFSSKECR